MCMCMYMCAYVSVCGVCARMTTEHVCVNDNFVIINCSYVCMLHRCLFVSQIMYLCSVLSFVFIHAYEACVQVY